MGFLSRLPSRNSRIVRWGGYALLAVALGYCMFEISRLGASNVYSSLSGRSWAITGGLGAIYGVALVLLATAWGGLAARANSLSLTDRLTVYGPGVLAKYIPGSVFQYGSRQLLGADYGLAQGAIAKASLYEAGLHVAAASSVGIALLLGGGWYSLLGVMLAGLALASRGASSLTGAMGFQLMFFSIFAGLVGVLAAEALSMPEPTHIAGIFMFAWIAGFLVPIAPGGLGVRESALLALASGHEAGAGIAALALLTRLVSTLGDAGFGLAGYWLLLSSRWNRQASDKQLTVVK